MLGLKDEKNIKPSNVNTNDKNNMNNKVYKEAIKLKRDNLPIKVSDNTWKIFENIQKIHPISIKIDYTYRNGMVSNNLRAQFRYILSEFEIDITIYDKNITEELSAHDALHAEMMVKGCPFFRSEDETIANLETGSTMR